VVEGTFRERLNSNSLRFFYSQNMSAGSKEEFRSAIQKQLRSDGVLDEMTATIRSRFLRSLLKDNGLSASAPSPVVIHSKAMLSLIYHFLEQHRFAHTLSVFAAESKLERTHPLSPVDAVKELGLSVICDKLPSPTIDILSLLRGAAHLILIQSEKQIESPSVPNILATKSIQTDAEPAPTSDNTSDICSESAVAAIERECEQRMRQEMNEKLKASAKTQAIQAMRRVEHKHKDALRKLHQQFDEERSQYQHRQDELTKKVEAVLSVKYSLQSEIELLNERVTEMHQQRLKEQDLLATKARADRHEFEIQNEALRTKETMLLALTQERPVLLAEIENLRNQQTTLLTTQNRALATMQEKYQSVKAELQSSKDEVAGLLNLLKQSQKAIESISFREMGAVSLYPPPTMYSTSAMKPVSQLDFRPRPTSGAENVSFARPTSAPYKLGDASSFNPFPIQSDLKEHIKQCVRESFIPKSDKNKSIDPPCCSSEDPPVSEPVERNEGRGGKSRHGEHDEIDKPIDAIVGLVLNLSAITETTEQVQQEGGLQNEAAKTEESSSDRSFAGQEDSIAVVADNPERNNSTPAEDVHDVPADHDLGIEFAPSIPSHALQSIKSVAESSKQDSEHVQSFEEEIYQSSANHRIDGELIPDQLIRGDSVSETNVDSNSSSPSGTAVSDTYSESFCSQSIQSKNV
jgi:hypothetical protein